MSTNIIKCNNIEYRKGFIEVSTDIHPGLINIEAWDIHPDLDIANVSIRDEEFPQDGDFKDSQGAEVNPVKGNVELELNIEQAKELVAQLQAAIHKVNG